MMKTIGNKKETMVKVPESALLSLVAEKLKGKVLFPNKIESAKKYLRKVKHSTL